MTWTRMFETTWTVSERLDYTIYELEKLQAKFEVLSQVLIDKGALTHDEIAQLNAAGNTVRKPK